MTREISVDIAAIFTIVLFFYCVLMIVEGVIIVRKKSTSIPVAFKPIMIFTQLIFGKQETQKRYAEYIKSLGPWNLSVILLVGGFGGVLLSILYFWSINFSIIKISEFQ